jgi:hypothetical protein
MSTSTDPTPIPVLTPAPAASAAARADDDAGPRSPTTIGTERTAAADAVGATDEAGDARSALEGALSEVTPRVAPSPALEIAPAATGAAHAEAGAQGALSESAADKTDAARGALTVTGAAESDVALPSSPAATEAPATATAAAGAPPPAEVKLPWEAGTRPRVDALELRGAVVSKRGPLTDVTVAQLLPPAIEEALDELRQASEGDADAGAGGRAIAEAGEELAAPAGAGEPTAAAGPYDWTAPAGLEERPAPAGPATPLHPFAEPALMAASALGRGAARPSLQGSPGLAPPTLPPPSGSLGAAAPPHEPGHDDKTVISMSPFFDASGEVAAERPPSSAGLRGALARSASEAASGGTRAEAARRSLAHTAQAARQAARKRIELSALQMGGLLVGVGLLGAVVAGAWRGQPSRPQPPPGAATSAPLSPPIDPAAVRPNVLPLPNGATGGPASVQPPEPGAQASGSSARAATAATSRGTARLAAKPRLPRRTPASRPTGDSRPAGEKAAPARAAAPD